MNYCIFILIGKGFTKVKFPAIWPLLKVTHAPKDPHGLVMNYGSVMMLGRAKVSCRSSLGDQVPGLTWKMKGPQLWGRASEVLVTSIHVHTVLIHHCRVSSAALGSYDAPGGSVLLPNILLTTFQWLETFKLFPTLVDFNLDFYFAALRKSWLAYNVNPINPTIWG